MEPNEETTSSVDQAAGQVTEQLGKLGLGSSDGWFDTEMWTNLAIQWGLKILFAVVILLIGYMVAKLIRRIVESSMVRGKVEETLVKFVGNVVYIGLMAFVVIAALGQVGVETSSFAAIVAAAGLAIGFALQGSLANFAAGFMIILFKPFKAGDFIEGAGISGVVEEVQIFCSILRTGDNKTIIVPNGAITAGNIVNYSMKETRRIDLIVGVGYDDNLDLVKKTLEELVNAETRILKDPECQIAVAELADSSVNFVVRPWVKTEDFWGVKFDLTESIKKTFDEKGINIPYPQQEVHMRQVNAA